MISKKCLRLGMIVNVLYKMMEVQHLKASLLRRLEQTCKASFYCSFTLDVGGGIAFDGRLVDGAFGNTGEIAALFSSNGNLPSVFSV